MSGWEARNDFSPEKDWRWVPGQPAGDTICILCGLAISAEDEAVYTSVWYESTMEDIYRGTPERVAITEPDWDDSLVYAHRNIRECTTAGTAVTVRTRE